MNRLRKAADVMAFGILGLLGALAVSFIVMLLLGFGA